MFSLSAGSSDVLGAAGVLLMSRTTSPSILLRFLVESGTLLIAMDDLTAEYFLRGNLNSLITQTGNGLRYTLLPDLVGWDLRMSSNWA